MGRYLLADADHHKPFSVAYLTGCFLLFRVEALKDVGLFDERFFMYPEDIDISRRMAEKWKVRYSPEAEVVHDHQAASRRNGKMLRVHVKNMINYFNKWGWLFDKKRHELNIRLQRELPYAVGEPEEGRG